MSTKIRRKKGNWCYLYRQYRGLIFKNMLLFLFFFCSKNISLNATRQMHCKNELSPGINTYTTKKKVKERFILFTILLASNSGHKLKRITMELRFHFSFFLFFFFLHLIFWYAQRMLILHRWRLSSTMQNQHSVGIDGRLYE